MSGALQQQVLPGDQGSRNTVMQRRKPQSIHSGTGCNGFLLRPLAGGRAPRVLRKNGSGFRVATRVGGVFNPAWWNDWAPPRLKRVLRCFRLVWKEGNVIFCSRLTPRLVAGIFISIQWGRRGFQDLRIRGAGGQRISGPKLLGLGPWASSAPPSPRA